VADPAPQSTLDLTSAAEAAPDAPTVISMPGLALPHQQRRMVRWLTILAKTLAIACAVIAVAVVVHWAMSHDPARTDWTLRALMAGCALVVVTAGAVHRHVRWVIPQRRMLKTVSEIRAGHLPIEELSKVDGGAVAVAPVFQELLREIRQQQAKITSMDMEVRHRVAQRTNALERAMGSLRQQAARDALTGLYNRRMMSETLPRLIAESRGAGRDLCLLMADVDYFKHLNDTRGHAAGDDFLRAVAQITRSSLREQDWAFRCGGDEFVVVLPDCTEQGAQSVITRITSLVQGYAKTFKVMPPPTITIGIARLSQVDQSTPEALLAAADRALYEHKASRPARHTRVG
jgi:diguanylate cyclase (GGDEF)-like protein